MQWIYFILKKLDGFCIVSSDSDFTRLAHRIRQDGVFVYGFGRRQTPKPFVAACDRFIHTELLDTNSDNSSNDTYQKLESSVKSEDESNLHELYELLKEAYEDIARDDGIANIGTVGQQLLKLNPAFDTRAYGHKKLGELLKATGLFEIKGNDVKLK